MNNGVSDPNNRVQRMYPTPSNSPGVNCFALMILAVAIVCGLAALGCAAAALFYWGK